MSARKSVNTSNLQSIMYYTSKKKYLYEICNIVHPSNICSIHLTLLRLNFGHVRTESSTSIKHTIPISNTFYIKCR